MAINNNTYDKYKVPSKNKTANEFTTKWLQHMCGIWCIIFIELVVKNLYLHPRDSSIHSSSTKHTRGDPILTNAEFKKNYYTTQASKGQTQPQLGHMELIIHTTIQADRKRVTTTVFYYKAKILSNLKFYWRGPHKADPKKIEETATQGSYLLVDSSTTCKNNTRI